MRNFKFSIKWNYKINDINKDGGRSGLETFPDGNNNYTIAQFFPRLAVYNNVEGWQNMQFWGRSEWALEFGDYEVNLTVPADHIVDATGVLQNEKDVLTKTQRKRWELSKKIFERPCNYCYPKGSRKSRKRRAYWHKELGNLKRKSKRFCFCFVSKIYLGCNGNQC